MLKKINNNNSTNKDLRTISGFWNKLFKKNFKLSYKALSLEDLKSRPNSAGAEPINICNADCSFCGYGKGKDGKAADPRIKQKIDINALKHFLRIYSDGGGGTFAFSPILGEISAHPDWLNIVKEIRKYKNINRVTCFTNATLLERHGFDEILKSGLTSMTISTAIGNKEQYKRLYGIDKYDQVKSNITNLLKRNKELNNPVNIVLALRIDKPYDLFYKSRFYKSIINYINPRKITILESWDDFRGIIKQDGLPKGHKFKGLRFMDERKNTPCYALYRKLQILVDGTIQGCSCRIEPELWGGNIKNYKSLHEAWNDKKIEKIRKDWFDGKLKKCCTECSHYEPYTTLLKDGYIIPHLKGFFKNLFNKKIRLLTDTGFKDDKKIRILNDDDRSPLF